MENLAYLLPFLACPVVMGLMMWLAMRAGPRGNPAPGQRMAGLPAAYPREAPSATGSAAAQGAPAAGRTVARVCGMCLNWKVLGALAVVGLAAWVVAPNAFGLVLLVLVLAVCPISMLLMMRGMQGGQSVTAEAEIDPRATSEAQRQARLAELRANSDVMEAHQRAVAREIAELEAGTTLRGNEAAAHAADEPFR